MRTHLSTRPHRAFAGAALALSLTLTVAACGSDDPASDSSASVDAAAHNEADVQFAGEMLMHHAQAIEMVDLTEGRDLSPKVQDLAAQIKAAQAPEIKTFTTWLTAWGQDVPNTSAGHDVGSSSEMPGMMSEQDMTSLEDASDADFRDMWLWMMIEHHEGAVVMAETQVEEGEYEPAVDLARTIADSQTNEIDTMKNLLS